MNIPGSGRFFQMIAVDNTARLMTESGMPRGGNDQFLASLCCQLAREIAVLGGSREVRSDCHQGSDSHIL